MVIETVSALSDFFSYSFKLYENMRVHGADCEVAAAHLAQMAPEYPPMEARLRNAMAAAETLSANDKEALKSKIVAIVSDFESRTPESEAVDARVQFCMESSATFAEVARKVAFEKKR